MARLPYLSAEDLPQGERHLLDRPINLFRGLAHNSAVLQSMVGIGAWIRYSCPFDPRLRELAILQVGYVSRSAYEFTHHVEIGLSFGVTMDDVHALAVEARGEASDLDDEARLVLEVARQLTVGTELDDPTWERLTTVFEPSAVLDLIFIITHYVQVVRILGALRVDVEPEYERYRSLLDEAGVVR